MSSVDSSIMIKRKDASQQGNNRKTRKPQINHADNKDVSTNKKFKTTKNECPKEISKPPKKTIELETDPTVLQRRQKQISYGKNTVGYHNYIQQIPVDKRIKEHPKTPDKYVKYSRRSWDALIKIWRKKLHHYDPSSQDNNEKSNSDYESDNECEDEED